MNGSVVVVFRDALANLLESVDAVLEVARAAEPAPEPTRALAAQLQSRFASAERLAHGKFVGNRFDAQRVATLCGAITNVQGAYLTYCVKARQSSAPSGAPGGLADALVAAVETARSDLRDVERLGKSRMRLA
jgi:hypothetical protein